MARIPALNIFTFSLLIFLLTIHFSRSQEDDYEFVKSEKAFNARKEKLSHFRFFWHETFAGPNASSIRVVESPGKLPNDFGFLNIFDNPLIVGPEPGSKIVGRAQGLYASASHEQFALYETINFVILEGKYNGSTITVLGRNPTNEGVREMPIVGGSGLFRFARGYALAKPYNVDLKTGDVIVEFNLHVVRY